MPPLATMVESRNNVSWRLAAEHSHADSSPVCPARPLNEAKCSNSQRLPAIPRRRKIKKSISFAPNVRAKRHLHINDYSAEELEACWFDSEESATIKEECLAVAMFCSTAQQNVEDNYRTGFCKRGVEHLTQIGAEQRMNNKIEAWDAILDAQEHMRGDADDDVPDPTYLANVYQSISYKCLTEAHLRALQDERDARFL